MPYLDKIPLRKVKILPELGDAAVGALLQFVIPSDNPITTVGLRCSRNISNTQCFGIVILEGTRTGQFITDEELNYTPTLDISDLSEIVIAKPALSIGSSSGSASLCVLAQIQR